MIQTIKVSIRLENVKVLGRLENSTIQTTKTVSVDLGLRMWKNTTSEAYNMLWCIMSIICIGVMMMIDGDSTRTIKRPMGVMIMVIL